MQVSGATNDFIAAFTLLCNTTFKGRIVAAIHPRTIHSTLAEVNLEEVLGKEAAYSNYKRGVHNWLIAPEDGVRHLLRNTFLLFEPPLRGILSNIHAAMADAAKAAMERSASKRKGKTTALEENLNAMLLSQALQAIATWRDQTWDQLAGNLHAEAEFPSPQRFETLKTRLQQLLGAVAARRAAHMAAEHKRMLAASLGYSLQSLAATNAASGKGPPSPVAAAPVAPSKPVDVIPSWSEFYMGWMEKKNRHGMWQRRWFALSVRQQRLWYFQHPEEQPARGTISLHGAVLVAEEDANDPHAFRVVIPSAFAAAAGGGHGAQEAPQQAKHGITLTGARTKTGALAMALRASSGASKKEWLDMLGKAIVGVPPEQEVVEPAPAEVSAVPNLPATPPAAELLEESEEAAGIERKISTKVFANRLKEDSASEDGSEKPGSKAVPGKPTGGTAPKKRGGRVSKADSDEAQDVEAGGRRRSTSREKESAEGDGDEEVDEESRAEAERQLFEEIAEQAASREPSGDELAVLECVTQAVREYVQQAQETLTEQASKIIADGLLPMNRTDQLHAALLKVLAGSDGGNSHAEA